MLVFGADVATADLIAYSSRSAFDSAAGASVSLLDFEAFTAANVSSGDSLGGVAFTYNLGNVSLKVVDSLPATSGLKSIGTDDQNMLLDGDNLDLSFASSTGFGLYVISSDSLLDDDVRLTVGSAVASLVSAAPQFNLGGNRLAWFLGIHSNDGTSFTSASLTTHGGGGLFNYNLDDFVSVSAIPEPSSLWLLFLVAAGLAGYRSQSTIDRN